MSSKSGQQQGFGTALRHLTQAAAVLAGLAVLVLAPGNAHAKCRFSRGSSQGTYVVAVPTTFVNDPGIAAGSVLYTSAPTNISKLVEFTCDSSSDSWGLLSGTGAPLPVGASVFPTGTAGIGYRVSQKGSYIFAYPYFSLGSSSSWQENDAVTIELIKTGAIADGSSLTGTLSTFKAGTSGSYIIDAVINLANKLTFTAPACQVNANGSNINVKLPAVTSHAFTGVGTVAGSTRFQIALTCSSGATVRLTLDTATPVAGKPGVIAPSSGSTTGIGVQVLDSSGVTAVNFGVPRTIGATPNGVLLVDYFARYYQTGSTVGAGLLGATATFTLSYQ